jgi:hypothetical protein
MAFYVKNIGTLQQGLRLVVGLGAAGASFYALTGIGAVLGIASGLMLAATGFVGYCPMCAIAGIGTGKRS